MKNMIVIGITGPTGSGKSTVCGDLIKNGYCVIDADKIAKQIIDESVSCKNSLAEYFGRDILDENNNLIRKILSERAFLNSTNLKMLNNITHPLIKDGIKSELDKCKSKGENVVILDVPLLFETRLDVLCNYTIAIISDENIRRERLIKRDNLSKDLINMRILAQNKDEYYKNNADYILFNNGNLNDIFKYTQLMISKIIGEKNET